MFASFLVFNYRNSDLSKARSCLSLSFEEAGLCHLAKTSYVSHKPSGVRLACWVFKVQRLLLTGSAKWSLSVSSTAISQGPTDFQWTNSNRNTNSAMLSENYNSQGDQEKWEPSGQCIFTHACPQTNHIGNPYINQREPDNWIICSLSSFHVDVQHGKPNHNQAFV